MATLGELIAELQAGGELDSTGEFTLARELAREKMRHFQLADPRSYVLELVQAAVLAGASWARFEIDADDMHLEIDGRPFTVEDLAQLHTAMFASSHTSATAAEAAYHCRRHDVTLNRRHPLVEKLLSAPETDPVLVAFLTSSVYSAMNHSWSNIEDDHEREFHCELTASLARCLAGRK